MRQRDTGFPAGTKVGLFISRSANVTADMISIQTMQGATGVESASGSELLFEGTADVTNADEYAHFVTTVPFTGVRVVIDVSGHSGDALHSLYEICGDGGRAE